MSAPADVVERLVDSWLSGDRDGARPMFDPECTFAPLRADRTHQGLEALERFIDGLPPEDLPAKVTPQSFLANGEKVVMLASVEFPRTGERSYTEHQSLGWVFTVREGRVVETVTYSSWADARQAAGMSDDTKPEVERRRGSRRLFMRANPALGSP